MLDGAKENTSEWRRNLWTGDKIYSGGLKGFNCL